MIDPRADWVLSATFGAFMSAVERDVDEVTQQLATLTHRGGVEAVFIAMSTWARVYVELSGLGHDTSGSTMAVIDPDNGLAEGDPLLWASRFIAASANDDVDMCAALFRVLCLTEDEGEALGAGVVTLLSVAANAARGDIEKS
jgi:hypothetical protein